MEAVLEEAGEAPPIVPVPDVAEVVHLGGVQQHGRRQGVHRSVSPPACTAKMFLVINHGAASGGLRAKPVSRMQPDIQIRAAWTTLHCIASSRIESRS